eukprot:c23671_g1_i1.p1 GENE.c23671_g1_i1~~c23671_g1_i1.p1  ORF type:complete len:561 (+),score=152.19 c23671_g1_i1:85-1767(+)
MQSSAIVFDVAPKKEENNASKVVIPEDDEMIDGGEEQKFKFSWKRLWAFTGPGWLMSMAYLDPGNLESDLQAGAYTGYQLVWVLFLSTLMGLLLQILAARLGVVTGKNLAQMCRAHYPRPAAYILWLMTEIAIIASDIQEVLGSAIAFNILFGIPLWAGCLITGCDTFTFLGLHFYGVRKLEVLFAFLIFIMVICFYVNWVKIGSETGPLFEGWFAPVQVFEHSYATVQAVGILGAVIMPHNIYLHSALVQSRVIDRTSKRKVAEANYYNAIESSVALIVAFFINLAVVAVFSRGFFDEDCAKNGYANKNSVNLACVNGALSEFDGATHYYDLSATCNAKYDGKGTCAEIGLQVAGGALSAVLRSSGKYMWAVGLLAAGQASTMTGTFAGQYVMEGFLDIRIDMWKRVLLTRSVALGPAIIVALATTHQKSLSDKLDEWLNILQSIQLPFAILPLLLFTSSTKVMGEFRNGPITKTVVWVLGGLVMVINAYLVYSFVFDSDSPVPHKAWFYAVVGIMIVLYFLFIGFVIKESLNNLFKAGMALWRGKSDKNGSQVKLLQE